MTKRLLPLLFAFLLLPAVAHGQLVGEAISLPSSETVDDNYVAFGTTVDVKGTVNGDVIVAAETVTIDGIVRGDVLVAARDVRISGSVEGNVRALGQTVLLNADVGKNVTVAGQTVILTADNVVHGTVAIAGQTVKDEGKTTKSLWVAAQTTTLSGSIGGNVLGYLGADGTLTVAKSADIGGRLRYTGTRDAAIDPDATIAGGVDHRPLPAGVDRQTALEVVYARVLSIFGSILIGLVLISLRRSSLQALTTPIREHFWLTIVWGAVAFIVVPVLVGLLFFTLVGVPLAIILIAFYVSALLAAMAVVGFAIGEAILRLTMSARVASGWSPPPFLSLVVGVALLVALQAIPVAGWIVQLTVFLLGIGAVTTAAWRFARSSRGLSAPQKSPGTGSNGVTR